MSKFKKNTSQKTKTKRTVILLYMLYMYYIYYICYTNYNFLINKVAYKLDLLTIKFTNVILKNNSK